MNEQRPALLMGFDNTKQAPSDANRAIMHPLVTAQCRTIERLEAQVNDLLVERDTLKMRIFDLEERLYRNSRDAMIRAKFDEESA